MRVFVTGALSITPVGLDALATAAAVRAAIGNLKESDDYADAEDNPILVGELPAAEGLTDEEDIVLRMQCGVRAGFERLLDGMDLPSGTAQRHLHILLGLPTPERPGPPLGGERARLAKELAELAAPHFREVTHAVIAHGNPSALGAIQLARERLRRHPHALCVIAAVDSLLDEETLDWLEAWNRLKSETFGRHHGLSPGEAIGFFALGAEAATAQSRRRPLAEVLGVGLAREPAPLLSDQPSQGEGLTRAVRAALEDAGLAPGQIDAVFGDLNGEFFRAKEWGLAELRALNVPDKIRPLWHPADCFGDIGAASGAVLVNLSAVFLSKHLAGQRHLCFCSDDHGARAAVILGAVS